MANSLCCAMELINTPKQKKHGKGKAWTEEGYMSQARRN